jgi:hypothetical protein
MVFTNLDLILSNWDKTLFKLFEAIVAIGFIIGSGEDTPPGYIWDDCNAVEILINSFITIFNNWVVSSPLKIGWVAF